jgi:MFS family permease
MMLIARAFGGLCSGNTAVIHAVVGELTDPSNQALALPIYGLVWPLGSIIGCVIVLLHAPSNWQSCLTRPLLGGTFSHPALKFQLLDWPFLRDYPYFLPCLIAGVLGILGIVVGFFFLDEVGHSEQIIPKYYLLVHVYRLYQASVLHGSRNVGLGVQLSAHLQLCMAPSSLQNYRVRLPSPMASCLSCQGPSFVRSVDLDSR